VLSFEISRSGIAHVGTSKGPVALGPYREMPSESGGRVLDGVRALVEATAQARASAGAGSMEPVLLWLRAPRGAPWRPVEYLLREVLERADGPGSVRLVTTASTAAHEVRVERSGVQATRVSMAGQSKSVRVEVGAASYDIPRTADGWAEGMAKLRETSRTVSQTIELRFEPGAGKVQFGEVFDVLRALGTSRSLRFAFAGPSRARGAAAVSVPPVEDLNPLAREPEPGPDVFPWRSREAKASTKAGKAVEDALDWLAAHQSPDGRWSCGDFGAVCDGQAVPPDRRPDGAGKPEYDVGVTGLALGAFLSAGRSDRGGHRHAEHVGRGLRWLLGQQDEEGCFGRRTHVHYIYEHAAAALAMVDAHGLSGAREWLLPARRALAFGEAARNPYFAWRYGVKPGDNDTSVTAAMGSVLAAALQVNEAYLAHGNPPPYEISEDPLDGIDHWLDKMTDRDYGRVGYITPGSGAGRPKDLVKRFPVDRTESTTAMGAFLRVFVLGVPPNDPLLAKQISLISRMAPSWNRDDGSIDLCFWHYASLVMAQVPPAVAKPWRDALHLALVTNQRRDTDRCLYKGSWDPVDPWGPDGGRVYATAMAVMCLTDDLRYDRLDDK
jgi:hypothetical protein